MSKIEVKDIHGKKVKDLELNDAVFGIEPNIPVVHSVIKNYLSSLRQGTHSTKGRSEVSGGGKKPWRQKGTGRARQGSIRATQWVGGGVPFGPTPHDHFKKNNRKEVKLAMRSVLSGKLHDGELNIVDSLDFKDIKTKAAVSVLDAFKIGSKRTTVVLDDDALEAYFSFRNISSVRVIAVSEATAHNLVDNKALLLTEEAAHKLEEVLA